ncbi:MAG TPA: radical SAM protein [Spirochaetota bacterium]|nr:radical SAM protein [Spirochaetota bacterium]HOS31742.1 radical SAM protein [Spirochaetota bacterium]HOS54552.1 radical SAM protein [Spirochaetota bacterium]HQF77194.1 radical SAM protein [Spirochaetota bacterium]HQH29581.1 radical SAM protein [Spirochaetota bacterium]
MSNKILDLKLTYRCNNNCLYCCQDRNLRKLNSDLTIEYVKKTVNEELPISKVVLTGGEPTTHSKIVEIIEYLHKKQVPNIQLQTNAKTLSDKIFLKNLINAGINSFGISIHGYNEYTHEAFTNTKNSFSNLVKALENIRYFDIPVALNCVVTKHNIDCLDKIYQFVIYNDFANTLQYAFIHITGNAKLGLTDYVNITEAAEAIKIIIAKNTNPNTKIFTEAIPFCLMTNYEKNVSELYINDNVVICDFREKKHFRQKSFKNKPSTCKKCLFNSICPGTWMEYPEIFGTEEFIPIKEFRSKYKCL